MTPAGMRVAFLTPRQQRARCIGTSCPRLPPSSPEPCSLSWSTPLPRYQHFSVTLVFTQRKICGVAASTRLSRSALPVHPDGHRPSRLRHAAPLRAQPPFSSPLPKRPPSPGTVPFVQKKKSTFQSLKLLLKAIPIRIFSP